MRIFCALVVEMGLYLYKFASEEIAAIYKHVKNLFISIPFFAFIQPLETGNYTFYSACDDECEVFLQHGESGGHLEKIISLTKATRYKVWK